MVDEVTVREPIIVHQGFIVSYEYAAGEAGSRFYVELRDKGNILGTRCPQCSKVYVPPRTTCGACFGKLDEWVKLKAEGTLMTYTVVHYSLPVHPVGTPFAYGIIRLDGADTGLTHLLGEVDLESIRIGMRVKAVFKEDRQGNILDIKYFKPL